MNDRPRESRWSFPWIKVYTDLPGHPKSIALSRELGDGAKTARGRRADGADMPPDKCSGGANKRAWAYVVQLWCWCASHAPEGRITSPHVVAIVEDACGWEGEPGKLFDAMVACRFLEKLKDGAAVHDWDEVQRSHFNKAKQDAERKRAARKTARGRRADRAGKSESESEILSSSKEEAASQRQPTNHQSKGKARRPSDQQVFAKWFEDQRREALNGNYSEDEQLSIQRLNAELAWIKDCDEVIVSEAARIYLNDPKRRQQDPPCRLLWFSQDRAEYISRAKRNSA